MSVPNSSHIIDKSILRTGGFAMVSHTLERDPSVDPLVKHFVAHLIGHMNANRLDDGATVSQAWLAHVNGRSVATIRRWTRDAEAAGLISVERQGHKARNTYRLGPWWTERSGRPNLIVVPTDDASSGRSDGCQTSERSSLSAHERALRDERSEMTGREEGVLEEVDVEEEVEKKQPSPPLRWRAGDPFDLLRERWDEIQVLDREVTREARYTVEGWWTDITDGEPDPTQGMISIRHAVALLLANDEDVDRVTAAVWSLDENANYFSLFREMGIAEGEWKVMLMQPFAELVPEACDDDIEVALCLLRQPRTPAEWRAMRSAAEELREHPRVSPQDIALRGAEFLRRWPDAHFTWRALVRQWDCLGAALAGTGS